jgi:hypothetical protein
MECDPAERNLVRDLSARLFAAAGSARITVALPTHAPVSTSLEVEALAPQSAPYTVGATVLHGADMLQNNFAAF